VQSATAICLTPQFSQLTIGAYRKALEDAIAGRSLQWKLVPSYAKHPQLIRAFAENLNAVLQAQPDAFVIFSAHSLPERALSHGDPYDYEVKETALLVAKKCRLPDWRFAYQSQGMTSEKWLGPTVEARLDEIASKSISKVVVMPVGFVCDHLETLYDIDIHFCEYAENKGIALYRAPSLNDSPLFVELLYQLAAR
jgi:ferrochelatase